MGALLNETGPVLCHWRTLANANIGLGGQAVRTVDNRAVSSQRFALVADVSSADPAAIERALRGLVDGDIAPTTDGFHLVATFSGESAQDLNRSLLSALRRVERRTRLRAAWTAGGVTERFFDYVSKGTRSASQ
jgi:hypothetical protein